MTTVAASSVRQIFLGLGETSHSGVRQVYPSTQDEEEPKLADLVQVLGQALATATLCYFILCFTLAFALARSIDLSILLYMSFQDYLKYGIYLNVFLACMLTLVALGLRTGLHIIPIPHDEFEFLVKWLKSDIKRQLSILFWLSVIVNLYAKLFRDQSKCFVELASWSFWISACIVLVFAVISLRTRFLIPVVMFIACVGANVYYGHAQAERMKQARANIRMHLLNSKMTEMIGTMVMPTSIGIIYMPSGVCEPPSDGEIQVISWSAVESFEYISERSCNPSLDHRAAPWWGGERGLAR
jgi:hypothetical protein